MQQPLSPSVVKETVRRHWAGRAATFDQAPNHGLHSEPQRAAWLELLRTWSGSEPLDALDVGCGTGFLALLLAHLGHRVAGVDVAEEMLRLAREKAAAAGRAIAFRPADAERLPFEDASFDLIVERHVIWTLPDPHGALAEWGRVLRPGGRLVLIEGAWQTTGHADYALIRDALPLYGGRPAAELAVLVAASGLAEPEAEPLMDAVLWGEAPERERYALHARKPR
jgi:ubiquinone/menaquinone biosynthesis C-methylase UbiE